MDKYLIKLTPEEKRERDHKEFDEIRHRARAQAVKERSLAEEQQDKVREHNRERKRKEREREKEREKALGLRDDDGKLLKRKKVSNYTSLHTVLL